MRLLKQIGETEMIKLVAYFPEGTELELAAIMERALKIEMMHVDDAGELQENKSKKKIGYKNAKGLQAKDHVLDFIADIPTNSIFKYGQVSKVMQERGFSKSAAGSVLKRLIKEGVIKQGKFAGEYVKK